jgi:dUTP pyrophosphatase
MSGLVEHAERSVRAEVKQTGLVYLAYPIDQAQGGETPQWHRQMGLVRQWLYQRGWGIYDPGSAWMVGSGQAPDRRLQSVNSMALGRSDAVVAFLPPGVPSIGVPMEIQKAAQSGIPVLVIGGADSWALAGLATMPWVRVGREFELVDDLLAWLVTTAIDEKRNPRQRAEPLLIRQLRDGEPAAVPTRHYDGDAGFDLTVSQSVTIQPGQMVDVPCNLAVELPDWAWGLIVGRSSTLRTKGLQVHMGVVDSGYRGELFAAVSTLGQAPVAVEAGERLAQLIVVSNQSRGLAPLLVSQLSASDRGTRGFGSSGR